MTFDTSLMTLDASSPTWDSSSWFVAIPTIPGRAPMVSRSVDDTDEIRFAWPVTGATITGEVSKGGAAFGAVAGAISFLRTEAGSHIYQIAYNAADRQEGSVRYIFTDGAYTRAVNLEVFGAVAGGGGGAVNVLPAVGIVADRSPGATINAVVGETISQSITLYATDGTTPINMTGKTLAIPFETRSGIDVAVVANADITVSGASSNVITFAYPAAVTASERVLVFAIKDAAAPKTLYLQGLCSVTRAPQVDA